MGRMAENTMTWVKNRLRYQGDDKWVFLEIKSINRGVFYKKPLQNI